MFKTEKRRKNQLNPIVRTYRYTIDWINSKGELMQNIIPAATMQEAMKKLQLFQGEVVSSNGSGKPRFVSIVESSNGKS